MGNDFIRNVYKRLNSIITQYAMDRYDSRDIKDYSNVRNLYDNHDYWSVKLVCTNGYNIVLRFDIVEATSYKHTKMLTIYIEEPLAVNNKYYDNGYINLPKTEYIVKNKRTFVEGQFNIEDQGWINSIITFMDRYISANQADKLVEDVN